MSFSDCELCSLHVRRDVLVWVVVHTKQIYCFSPSQCSHGVSSELNGTVVGTFSRDHWTTMGGSFHTAHFWIFAVFDCKQRYCSVERLKAQDLIGSVMCKGGSWVDPELLSET